MNEILNSIAIVLLLISVVTLSVIVRKNEKDILERSIDNANYFERMANTGIDHNPSPFPDVSKVRLEKEKDLLKAKNIKSLEEIERLKNHIEVKKISQNMITLTLVDKIIKLESNLYFVRKHLDVLDEKYTIEALENMSLRKQLAEKEFKESVKDYIFINPNVFEDIKEAAKGKHKKRVAPKPKKS
jgi:hypothetical protein